MSGRLRQEQGWTLVELLMAMAVFMFVVAASLDSLDGVAATTSANTRQNDAQDLARMAMDRMARQLRNLASPTNANIRSIDQASADDLVFQTVDPVKRRVRYCLDPVAQKLWMQTQAFALGTTDPGMPSTASCPGPTGSGSASWATAQVVATNVVNRQPSPNERVFVYTGNGVDPTASTVSDTTKITGVHANLWIDVNPGHRPGPTSISSGDFLRNQNQKPTASFTLQASPAGSRRYIMNASQSSDPEGRTLDYVWYKGTGSTANLPSCQDSSTQTGGGFTCLGQGVTFAYVFPSTDQRVQTITLKVVDPGGLTDVAQAQTASLP